MKKKNYGEAKNIKQSKFKCSTNGKYNCKYCGNKIKRGDTIRFVDVKFKSGVKKRFVFDKKTCKNKFLEENKIKLQ